MSSISDIISKSLKEKYQKDHNVIVNEGLTITLEEIHKIEDSILSESVVNNISSGLLTGKVVYDVINSSKAKRKNK